MASTSTSSKRRRLNSTEREEEEDEVIGETPPSPLPRMNSFVPLEDNMFVFCAVRRSGNPTPMYLNCFKVEPVSRSFFRVWYNSMDSDDIGIVVHEKYLVCLKKLRTGMRVYIASSPLMKLTQFTVKDGIPDEDTKKVNLFVGGSTSVNAPMREIIIPYEMMCFMTESGYAQTMESMNLEKTTRQNLKRKWTRCFICTGNKDVTPVGIVTLTCNHQVCNRCLRKLKKCPYCRKRLF